MKFKIAEKIFEKYPELEVGVVICNGLDNSKKIEEINNLLKDIEKEIKEKIDSEKILEIPAINKWRDVYKSFGAKPKNHKCSSEALLISVFSRGIPSINSLVDIYNYLSLKYTLTVGGEDISKIEGDLYLDFAKGDEEFFSIGSDENQSPKENEVVYKDDKGVVCRRWNWREADRTKLTEETKEAVIIIENLLSEEHDKFLQASNELKLLIEKYCGGKCNVEILNKNKQEVDLE